MIMNELPSGESMKGAQSGYLTGQYFQTIDLQEKQMIIIHLTALGRLDYYLTR